LCSFYAALLETFKDFQNFKKKQSLVNLILLNSLKEPNRVVEGVDKATSLSGKLASMVQNLEGISILDLGKFLRELGPLFHLTFLLAIARTYTNAVIS
jgi:hypothetical protein